MQRVGPKQPLLEGNPPPWRGFNMLAQFLCRCAPAFGPKADALEVGRVRMHVTICGWLPVGFNNKTSEYAKFGADFGSKASKGIEIS